MNRTKPFSALSKSFMSISSCVTDTARRKGWLKSFEEEEKKRKKKKDVWCDKSLPASPLNAFSTATPLSSSCLCFSSTCSNCLWMIWTEKKGAGQSLVINAEHRRVNAVTHTQYEQLDLSRMGARNNNGLEFH